MKKLFLSWVALAAIAAGGSSNAADIPPAPIYKAPPRAVALSSGFYLWADGSSQSIKLPTYDLGWRLQGPGQGIVAANTFNPRATGYGVSGGLGFVLPPGMFLSNVGTNARIEFGGSYVNATASQASSTTSALAATDALPQLSGVTTFGGVCVLSCIVSGKLSTNYSSWQTSGRFATDYKVNGVTFTPSLAVFGGKSRNAQTLSETNLLFNGVFFQYDANTKLSWTDWGSRAGLTGSVPVTDWLTFVAGGTAGLAARSVSLAGLDSSSLFAFGGAPIAGPFPSTVQASQSTTAFVANAETSVIIRFAPSWSLRAFGGLNYDNKVPGVSAPAVILPVGFGGNGAPAGIKYQAETSYYTGGGLTAKF